MDARADGKPVSYHWIHKMAIKIFQNRNPDSVVPQFSNFWIKKFLNRFDLGVRCASSSRADNNACGELIQRYTNEIKEIINNYSIKQENIFNMDETGINFDMSSVRTVDLIGKRKISIAKNYASKSRFSAVLTISASGVAMKPMIIFKGVRIPQDLRSSNPMAVIKFQKNAWMTKELMLEYVDSLPNGTDYKLLIMDSFTVHKNKEVLEKLESKNFIPFFVPAGYTDLLQPLDVSIMKPLKSKIRIFYDDWLHGVSIINHKLPVPKKCQLVEWVTQSLFLIPAKMIMRSFGAASIEIPDVGNVPVNPFISRPEFNNWLYDSDAEPNFNISFEENIVFE